MSERPPPFADQARLWRAKAGDWTAVADRLAGPARAFNDILIDAAGIAPGDYALDLASGAGEPALQLAARVGPAGLAVASDIAPGMLAGVRARARAGPAPALVVSDMTRPAVKTGVFDAVTCRFGLMFVPDPAACLAACRRVLRPGGRLALMVWGPRAHNSLIDCLDRAVTRALGRPTGPHIDLLFRFADAGSLSGALRAAGFDAPRESEHRFDGPVPGGEAFWRAQARMIHGHLLAPGDDAARARVDAAMRALLPARLQTHVRVAVAAA